MRRRHEPPQHSGYQYVVLRCVPRVDREEFVNVGVVVYCQARDFLRSASRVDAARLRALGGDGSTPRDVEEALAAIEAVCAGDGPPGSPASEPIGIRFGFVSRPAKHRRAARTDPRRCRRRPRLPSSGGPARPAGRGSMARDRQDRRGTSDTDPPTSCGAPSPTASSAELCERLPVGEALDLACGEGRNALWLARLGWRVLGVDFSEAAIERARAAHRRRGLSVSGCDLTWKVADVTVEPHDRSRHDLALVSYVHI